MRRTRNPRAVANQISKARQTMNRAQRFGKLEGTTSMVPDEATLPPQATVLESKFRDGPFIVWRWVGAFRAFVAGTRTLTRARTLAERITEHAIVTTPDGAIVFDNRKDR